VGSPKPLPRSIDKTGVVVDASVLLKLLLPEKESDLVRRLWGHWLEQDTEIVAPFLLAYEVISVLRNKVFRGELPPEAGEAAFVAFRTQEISLLHPEGIEEKAWGLARRWNLPTGYDAAYLALAELLDYEFWTADRRFAASLRKNVSRMRLISG
jgi:predicted nucleic acid-binding protein